MPEQNLNPDAEAITCPKCGAALKRRDAKSQTTEQLWCGTWYDHPITGVGGCLSNTTALVPSKELLNQQAQNEANHA